MTARTTAACVNPMLTSEGLQRAAEQAEAAECGDQADPGHSRRQNERKLDQRDHEPPTWKRRVATR